MAVGRASTYRDVADNSPNGHGRARRNQPCAKKTTSSFYGANGTPVADWVEDFAPVIW